MIQLNVSTLWKPAVGVLVFVALWIGGAMWLHQHDADLKAQAQSTAMQARADEIAQGIQQRDAATTQQNAALEQQKAQQVTPATAVQTINHYVVVPGNQAIVLQHEDLGSVALSKLPDAPDYVVQTDKQAGATAQALISCTEDHNSLITCQADQKDQGTELQLMTADRDHWKTVSNGGTWWKRALTAAKWAAVGAGAGYVAGRQW